MQSPSSARRRGALQGPSIPPPRLGMEFGADMFTSCCSRWSEPGDPPEIFKPGGIFIGPRVDFGGA